MRKSGNLTNRLKNRLKSLKTRHHRILNKTALARDSSGRSLEKRRRYLENLFREHGLSASKEKKSLLRSRLKKLFKKTTKKYRLSFDVFKKIVDENVRRDHGTHLSFASFFRQIIDENYEAMQIENDTVKYKIKKGGKDNLDTLFLRKFRPFEHRQHILARDPREGAYPSKTQKKFINLNPEFKKGFRDFFIKSKMFLPHRRIKKPFSLVSGQTFKRDELDNSSFQQLKDKYVQKSELLSKNEGQPIFSVFRVLSNCRRRKIVSSLLRVLYRLMLHDLGLLDASNPAFFPRRPFESLKAKFVFKLFAEGKVFKIQFLVKQDPLLLYQHDHVE